MAPAPIVSANSSLPVVVQFRAGKMPRAVQFSTLPEVPSWANCEYSTGLSFMASSMRLRAALNLVSSAMATEASPRRAIALRFLAPITAPRPRRPTTRRSLTMQASRDSFSPAGPMHEMRTFWSCSLSLMTCWQSPLCSPQSSSASRNVTLPSLIHSHVGFSATPSTMMTS